MVNEPNLAYDPESLLDKIDLSQVESAKDLLSHQGIAVEFDEAYLRHLSRYHGGSPKKRRFCGASGTEYAIERFLNFASEPYTKESIGLYNIVFNRGLIEDRLDDFLVPFAVLFAGDYLCFDTHFEGRPSIVVWRNSMSPPGFPSTDFISDNFDTFLHELS